ncbi:MAG: hypothetical protein ABIP65_08125 [Vicinamibacterales bacterium]
MLNVAKIFMAPVYERHLASDRDFSAIVLFRDTRRTFENGSVCLERRSCAWHGRLDPTLFGSVGPATQYAVRQGRHVASLHADLRCPPRLADWSDHHLLIAMSRRGEDLPGNLIVGDESFARWQELEIVSRAVMTIQCSLKRRPRVTRRVHQPAASGQSSASWLMDGIGSSSLLREELRLI